MSYATGYMKYCRDGGICAVLILNINLLLNIFFVKCKKKKVTEERKKETNLFVVLFFFFFFLTVSNLFLQIALNLSNIPAIN